MPRPEFREKSIRSFVIRQGRITASQKAALDKHWSAYGLSLASGPIKPDVVFGREAPLVVEIGYGMGQSLVSMATDEPDKDFIGIEVHPPGVGSLLHLISERSLTNLKTYMADATDVLQECLSPDSISRLQVYFPDPWPKKKHHKRRLIQPAFVQLLASRIKPGGLLHLATDWHPYAEHMHEVVAPNPHLQNQSSEIFYTSRPKWRPPTKFELRGENLGHEVFDLVYKKI